MKSYSGYVHLPPGVLSDVNVEQPYPINTFFWFFESRHDPQNAPLSIWMNGGPGSSSIIGLLQENGPCSVNDDSNSTVLNPWSWNNHVNMLYIDQPNQVGFSYDVPTNGTYSLESGEWDVSGFPGGEVPEQNSTLYVGTFPSQRDEATANMTENAARSLWQFAQTWFSEFPAYKPNDDRVSIWTESYGGRYGPSFAAFFQRQNERIADGELEEYHPIHLDTLGILNGCVDLLTQAPYYPQMAYNNTYGLETINKTSFEGAMHAWSKPNGCRDRILECRRLAAQGDPGMTGQNATANKVCRQASSFCSGKVEGAYTSNSGRGYYDISHVEQDPFPPQSFLGFLSQHWVQGALGVPINFTKSVDSVGDAFTASGDYARSDVHGYLHDIAYLLDSGIKVALVYGDRDYACSWNGGEAVSLAVDYTRAEQFHAAGYAPLQTNSSYVGGRVRQHGNFSFSRVFESGHEVPAYQPQTAYEIFQRAMFNKDIATGQVSIVNDDTYSSEGPLSTWHIKNDVPESPKPVCYVLALSDTCTEDQKKSVLDGSAVIKDYVVVGSSHDHPMFSL